MRERERERVCGGGVNKTTKFIVSIKIGASFAVKVKFRGVMV